MGWCSYRADSLSPMVFACLLLPLFPLLQLLKLSVHPAIVRLSCHSLLDFDNVGAHQIPAAPDSGGIF